MDSTRETVNVCSCSSISTKIRSFFHSKTLCTVTAPFLSIDVRRRDLFKADQWLEMEVRSRCGLPGHCALNDKEDQENNGLMNTVL
ncbi:hypothetical protein BgiBS90_005953, partial [Biomphalaria glabrata]